MLPHSSQAGTAIQRYAAQSSTNGIHAYTQGHAQGHAIVQSNSPVTYAIAAYHPPTAKTKVIRRTAPPGSIAKTKNTSSYLWPVAAITAFLALLCIAGLSLLISGELNKSNGKFLLKMRSRSNYLRSISPMKKGTGSCIVLKDAMMTGKN